jgi:hypothetical protein
MLAMGHLFSEPKSAIDNSAMVMGWFPCPCFLWLHLSVGFLCKHLCLTKQLTTSILSGQDWITLNRPRDRARQDRSIGCNAHTVAHSNQ